MHQKVFSDQITFFKTMLIIFDFRAQIFPFIVFKCKYLLTSTNPAFWGSELCKNNIQKAPVKFREDLLYFQHFMLIFVFVPNY